VFVAMFQLKRSKVKVIGREQPTEMTRKCSLTASARASVTCSRHIGRSVAVGYTGVQWALDGRPHTCRQMAWRRLCLVFPDKYQLIGTLISDCSCHSNDNSAAAPAAADNDDDAAAVAAGSGNTPASEGINSAVAAAEPSKRSSGLCVLI